MLGKAYKQTNTEVKKMRKVMLMVKVISFFATSAYAVIAGSKHDLTAGNLANVPVLSASNIDETCVFCHTPHNASSSGTAPLWNRTNDTAPTGTYGNPTGSMVFAPMAADVALTDAVLCLSCHDGSIGNTLTNAPNGPAGDITPALTENWAASSADMGADMSNDHPIGMSYGDAQGTDSELQAAPALPFFAQTLTGANAGAKTDVMWCSSCHDVHGQPGVGLFLQVDNTASALCLTCHIK
jgi:predicted CXXCH cytochrome family protein